MHPWGLHLCITPPNKHTQLCLQELYTWNKPGKVRTPSPELAKHVVLLLFDLLGFPSALEVLGVPVRHQKRISTGLKTDLEIFVCAVVRRSQPEEPKEEASSAQFFTNYKTALSDSYEGFWVRDGNPHAHLQHTWLPSTRRPSTEQQAVIPGQTY